MNKLEAARIMMDGSGSGVDLVDKLIIANGHYTPDSGQMWGRAKVDIDRYYTQIIRWYIIGICIDIL